MFYRSPLPLLSVVLALSTLACAGDSGSLNRRPGAAAAGANAVDPEPGGAAGTSAIAGAGGQPQDSDSPPPSVMPPTKPAPPGPIDDPDCPPVIEPQLGMNECDLFAATSDCEAGLSCVPFVDYPERRCDSEVFGTTCEPVGSAGHGEPCDHDDCAEGLLCVITGRGTQCSPMCDLRPGKASSPGGSCALGLICQPVDVANVGVCLSP